MVMQNLLFVTRLVRATYKLLYMPSHTVMDSMKSSYNGDYSDCKK